MRALGAGFLDEQGRPVPPGGRGLLHLHRIDPAGLDPRLSGVSFTVLADVDNPLTGPDGAARVFGPQKGADPDAVVALDRGLANLARVAARDLGSPNLATLPGGGAAGGLGLALVAFLGARIVSGIDYVMEATGLAEQMAWADIVVTGEGQLDGQSRHGKACSGVARLAGAVGRPVVAIVGAVVGENEAVQVLGLDAVLPVPTGPVSLVQAMAGATGYLEAAGTRLARLLLIGGRLAEP
jgi:glycerate kinase